MRGKNAATREQQLETTIVVYWRADCRMNSAVRARMEAKKATKFPNIAKAVTKLEIN